jgi:hypothetical protein
MNVQQAVQHEKSHEHLQAIERRSAPAPVEAEPVAESSTAHALTILNLRELKETERREWNDMVPETVAFWHEGVCAAERGETPESVQLFLERLEAQFEARRRENENDWGSAAPTPADAEHGYGGGAWGSWGPVPSQRERSARSGGNGVLWDQPHVDDWGVAPNPDPWATVIAPATWDEWGAPPKVATRNAHGLVLQHPQGSRDSSCSHAQVSGGSRSLREVAGGYASRSRLAPVRKNRLEHFVQVRWLDHFFPPIVCSSCSPSCRWHRISKSPRFRRAYATCASPRMLEVEAHGVHAITVYTVLHLCI